MPVIETKGALSSQGFGEFTKVGGPPVYIEDVFQTWLYTGNSSSQAIANGLPLGTTASLVGKTITNLGGNFDGSYPLSNLNDGIAEIANAENIAFVPTGNGFFDVYVDMGVSTVVTEYLIAPQGNVGAAPFNSPTAFTVKASNDASTWTTITSFTSISTTYPDWNPGSFRSFSFTNTTGYRYWRLENTTKGSSAAGVAISEWRLVVSTTAKSGLVWIKGRSAASNHILTDTTRGAGVSASNNNALASNLTSAEDLGASYDYLSAFLTNGFAVTSGGTTTATRGTNYTGVTYVGWTFVEQPKFFDVTSFTTTSFGQTVTVSNSLGSAPGAVFIKRTTDVGNWYVWHRSLTSGKLLYLNSTAAEFSDTTISVSGQTISFTSDASGNNTWVAYIFAHNAGGFGLTGNDNVISCGSFTVDGLGEFPQITLGYEPQFFIAKRITGTGDWFVMDTMRGFIDNASTSDVSLAANTSAAEAFGSYGAPAATGVIGTAAAGTGSFASGDYIYIAIRRGPMKVPTSGTSVFTPVTYTGTGAARSLTAGFPIDLAMFKYRGGTSNSFEWFERLLGTSPDLRSAYTFAELATTTEVTSFASNTQVSVGASSDTGGTNASGYTYVLEAFRRAPGFFDVVCFTASLAVSNNQRIPHSLGVVPELVIFKNRSNSEAWWVWSTGFASNQYLRLNGTAGIATQGNSWPTPMATATDIGIRPDGTSLWANGDPYVAYLFATCAGVSKVGTYTGTGNTLQIDCGFTGGARYVLIKRTDSTGDWYVWDSARGIVAGNDPYLLLNSTAAEVTNTDWVDTHNPGFELSNAVGNNVNINTATYLFLAIA